jgi:exosome complex component RRP43
MVCGIRGEILLAKDIPGLRVEEPNSYTGSGEESARSNSNKMRELDLLVPNIELSTGCSPAHLPGQAPSSLAQSLTSRIYSLLHGSRMLDAEELRIYHTPEKVSSSDNEDGDEMADDETEPTQQREIKAYWTLYIDILCISLDGNALDAAWASVLAALRNLKLPHAYWDIDKEAVLCDPSPALHQKLTLNGLPVASSFVVFRESEREEMSGRQVEGKGKKEKAESWILTDPDAFEESLCGERVTLVVDCESGKTRIRRIEKGGGTVIGREEMGEMVRLAEGRWREWSAVLEGLARSG